MTSDGTNTYSWDADNRLIEIAYPGTANNSQFTYDEYGNTVRIVETSSGTITSIKQFVWCGEKMCEARNASGSSLNQYYALGETISGAGYFYVCDHLGLSANVTAANFSQLEMIGGHPGWFDPLFHSGSIREMTNGSGVVEAEYSFDPDGRATLLQGSLASDFQYAGYYLHAPSGLSLAVHRAYNASRSRWMNRDPRGEAGGINLYAYVNNEPTAWFDPLGLVSPIELTPWLVPMPLLPPDTPLPQPPVPGSPAPGPLKSPELPKFPDLLTPFLKACKKWMDDQKEDPPTNPGTTPSTPNYPLHPDWPHHRYDLNPPNNDPFRYPPGTGGWHPRV